MPSTKRAHDLVDLTGDDDIHMSSQAPVLASQADRDSWLEENDADDVIVSTQDGGDDVAATYQLYSVVDSKIVGVQYYRGLASRGEYVSLRREPSNQYDHNAICVENVQRAQIGHIPRGMASKLAKYMDSGALIVEGALANNIGTYDCPIILKLFGTSEPVERANLRNQMRSDKLPTTMLDEKEKEAKRRKAEELKKMAAAKRSAKVGKGSQNIPPSSDFAGTSSQRMLEPEKSLEEFIEASQRFDPREMGEVAEKFGATEDVLAEMPMANCPKELSTELLPYQRQALAWLLEKENPQMPPEGSDDAVQLWKRDKRSNNIYTNVATNYSIQGQPPKLGSGGILSDDMGLGKTIEMISLMAADPLKTARRKTTLIVCPVGLMSNWSGQIAQHVREENAFNVHVYHGPGKKSMGPAEFNKFDVVITSYGTLASEYFSSKKSKEAPPVPRSNGIFSVDWRRVILDEGHTIRNPQTKSALAANNVISQSRWVLTGTPIVNSLRDLYSLVRFIRLSGGLERLDIFNSILIRPLKSDDPNASLLLQALMTAICLRRKKDMKFVDLRLPEKTEYVHRFPFADHEKVKYEALQAEAKGLLRNVRNAKPGKGTGDNYRHLLEILLRLRQVCNHWKLCGERVTEILSILETQKTVDLTPENRAALQAMLQLSIESHEDCSVCLEPLHNPVITHCAHVYGADCIEKVIEMQQKCPMCRAELPDTSKLVKPLIELGESYSDIPEIDPETTSSKIEELVKIISASQKKDPETKTVIFSQWTSFLNIIQSRLASIFPDMTIARIDGSMPPRARDAALQSLNEDPDCKIMLASLAVCSVGLNLVAANQVVMADSWWAPAIEDQAVDRVHRLGQKRACTVWRLVVEETVEERVLGVQGEKRALMGMAFREKVKKEGEGRERRIADIERLLN